ncbi:hypothetical protein TR13x_07430 [Caloranaerobacter sp. TR13]|uniref:LytR/AlgR family response regulator transcription factor n=1 Tax=Caloranaerobacter sp. TR13 TaxID=1302151 RepID=UPI0006D9B66B|nr:response regulator [Caloranaerobacter sp. TR13]KPU26989.1 hypothetical protein TR13x_07430 [Caloranaerobacter sp. TR13]
MDKLKIFIVDDEVPARQELKYLLEENFKDRVKVVGEAEDGWSALEKINEMNPDVIFLDIKMPEISGLEVAQIITEKNSSIKIVFVTAFDEFALKAFEINAIDYLVKPVCLSRLRKTILRLNDSKNTTKDYEKKIEKLISKIEKLYNYQQIEKIPCEEYGKFILIKRSEICYCMAENGKSYVCTKDKKLKTFYSLKELENKLGLFRAHRSYLVNLDYIKMVQPLFHGSFSLILNDGFETEIPVSRIQSKKLREILHL